MSLDRREFLVGLGGIATALAVRGVGAQQQPNTANMNQDAYRAVFLPAKEGATPQLDNLQRDALEKQLKCQCTCVLDVYTCRTTDFSCGVSPAMHRDVMRLISGGYDADEIKKAFVDVYGEVALTAPVKEGFNWVGYFAPSIVLATGGIILTMMLRRWSTRAAVAAPIAAGLADSVPAGTTAEELERLKRALREEEL
jgi:cytochrome c-type biogenesis protein CcmH